jgi:hypothetical protein
LVSLFISYTSLLYCMYISTCHTKMCCTNFEYSKVSLEAVNKPFYGFSQWMCNSVEVVKNM